MPLGSSAFVWSDRALFIGHRSETEVHAHHAVEITVALDELGVDVALDDGPSFSAAPGVIVRATVSHRLTVHGPKIGVLYLDPRSAAAAALEEALGEEAARALDANSASTHASAVRALLEPTSQLDDANAACQKLLASVAPTPVRPRLDHRVRQALELVDSRLEEPPTLHEAASHVGLSATRLGHLFKAQVGLPLRRYILWMRLRTALTEALESGNMTAAAHVAGFADAAHFARTCKRMFGLPATAFAPVDRVLISH